MSTLLTWFAASDTHLALAVLLIVVFAWGLVTLLDHVSPNVIYTPSSEEREDLDDVLHAYMPRAFPTRDPRVIRSIAEMDRKPLRSLSPSSPRQKGVA